MVELSGGVRLGHHRKQQEGRYSTYLFAPGREDPWVDPGEFLIFWTQTDADYQDFLKNESMQNAKRKIIIFGN